MRSTRGHTVIELLVVVAIMMILAAIALPSASRSPERRLDTAQLEMQDALDHAASLATSTADVYGVRFNADEGWFAVVDASGHPVDDPLSHMPYLVKLNQPGEPADVVIDSAKFAGHTVAVFDEKGVMYAGGQVHLRSGTTCAGWPSTRLRRPSPRFRSGPRTARRGERTRRRTW